MKNYFKGLICGSVLTAAIMCIPAVAENISVTFNSFRINVNGSDVAQWGENYTLDNGAEVPYSIVYNDTTYLPLRKIGELTGKYVAYNGDTGTVSLSYHPQNEHIVAEKPDANGNVWKYYTYSSGNDVYLGVKDEARGFERIYKTMSSDPETAVTVTDDAIYFAKFMGEPGYPYDGSLQRIYFMNDANTQDGESIFDFYKIGHGSVIFDNEYIYLTSQSEGTMRKSYLEVSNIFNPEEKIHSSYNGGAWTFISGLHMGESGVLTFTLNSNGGYKKLQIVFDKEKKEFSEPVLID